MNKETISTTSHTTPEHVVVTQPSAPMQRDQATKLIGIVLIAILIGAAGFFTGLAVGKGSSTSQSGFGGRGMNGGGGPAMMGGYGNNDGFGSRQNGMPGNTDGGQSLPTQGQQQDNTNVDSSSTNTNNT